MNESKIAEERIKKLLLNDKISSYTGFIEILKTELKDVLKEYLELSSIEINIETKDSKYILDIIVKASNIVSPNTIN